MPRLTALLTVIAFLAAPLSTFAQQPNRAGVVTTLEGNVTATRATAAPTPLHFKDAVFLQDRIATAEQSLARMLLGGKAVVTIRERSVLTITEIPGRSTIEIDSGKFALAVAREKMRPGEVIEIRTPNAIAGVRGTVVVTEVETPPGAGTPASSLYVLQGNIDAQPRDPATRAPVGTPQTVNVLQQFRVVGLVPAISAIAPGQLAATLTGPGGTSALFTPVVVPIAATKPEATNNVAPLVPLTPEAQNALAKDEVPGVSNTSTSSSTSGTSSTGTVGTADNPTGNPFSAGKVALVGGLLTNPGFETGDFTGWTLTGAGAVISAFGTLTPREGHFMGLIHTRTGSTLPD